MKIAIILSIMLLFSKSFAQDTTRLSLLFFGDIMQHDSQISDAYDRTTKKYNYDPCFQFVKPYMQSAHLAIGNLELTLAGPPYKGYPQFSAPDELLITLKKSGVDVLVTANNHCVDTGKKGLERTIKMLDSLNIPHTGTFVDEVTKLNDHPLLVRKNGFTLAVLNYTYGTNGLPVTPPNIVNLIDTTVIRKDLNKAKSLKPDVIVVFMHWGAEYQRLPSKWQKDIAGFCFNKGAQLVVGAHPHVLQPMEWRKEKNQLVTYSLGNFVSGQRKRYTDGGGMLWLELEKVQFSDGSAFTRIDSASYILEWVYRTTDAGKKYFILPVPAFEKNYEGFVKDTASREAFKLFIEDSRSLFKQNNIQVGETSFVPADSIKSYRVLIANSKEGGHNTKLVSAAPYGYDTEKDDTGNTLYFSGSFFTKSEAEKYRRRLLNLGFTEALVVESLNGPR